jgi:hypothetical protein
MTFLDFLCVAQPQAPKFDESTATFECDYDKNPSSLYQAMESKAWVPTLEFFETGKWQSSLLFSGEDPLPPERQARTWVTRFESDGKVRWSQLPLHAALIFGAPFKIIATLVTLYPQGVRCTDDQHMLPLHLAMKFGAEDTVVRLLIEHFPQSLFTKDIRGRLPTQMDGPRKDRTIIMDEIVNVTTKTLQKKHGLVLQDELAELKDDLVLQNKLNAEQETQKKELEIKFHRTQTEVVILRNELKELKEKPPVRDVPVEIIGMDSALRHHSNEKKAIDTEKKGKPTRSFVFGKKKPQDQIRQNPETPTRRSSVNSKSQPELDQALKAEEKSTASMHGSDSSTVSKENANSAQVKKLPRRGFFKGFGARE